MTFFFNGQNWDHWNHDAPRVLSTSMKNQRNIFLEKARGRGAENKFPFGTFLNPGRLKFHGQSHWRNRLPGTVHPESRTYIWLPRFHPLSDWRQGSEESPESPRSGSKEVHRNFQGSYLGISWFQMFQVYTNTYHVPCLYNRSIYDNTPLRGVVG